MEEFPCLNAWFQKLPDGWNSYPEALTKASILHQYLAMTNFPFEKAKLLPSPISELVASPPPLNSWIPSAHSFAVSFFLRDCLCDDDKAFEELVFQSTSLLYQRPFYKLLMVVTSPERLLRLSERRWETFYQGSNLRFTEQSKHGAVAILSGPAHLYNDLVLVGMCGALRAAFCATGTPTEVTWKRISTQEASIHVSFARNS